MGKNVKVDFKGLEQFQKQFEQVNQSVQQDFVEQCAKELTARLLRKVIKRTPVGERMKKPENMSEKITSQNGKSRVMLTAEGARYKQYWEGYQGGTLRRGWVSKTEEEARAGKGSPQTPEILEYVDRLKVIRSGNLLRVIIPNVVSYASYVEYGHVQEPGRYVPALGKSLKVGFVPGKRMMTYSVQEIQSMAPAFLRKRLEEKLREAFQ